MPIGSLNFDGFLYEFCSLLGVGFLLHLGSRPLVGFLTGFGSLSITGLLEAIGSLDFPGLLQAAGSIYHLPGVYRLTAKLGHLVRFGYWQSQSLPPHKPHTY